MNFDQNDYDCYAEGQFAADEYFQQWVLKANSATSQFWESYLLLHPTQSETIKNARLLVKELAAGDYHTHALSAEERSTIKENVYLALDLPFPSRGSVFFSAWKKNWKRLSAVAVLAIIAVPVYFLTGFGTKSAGSAENTDNALLVKTGAGEIKTIKLRDSSVVILNANSSLRCGKRFQTGSGREVFLEGNAYFNVAKDPRHSPFIVHARSLVITVLGTELNVNARSAQTEVELTRGKVKVETETNKMTPVYLQPGERIKLDPSGQAFIRSKMNAELYSAWTEGQWNFHQTTLEDITALLHEYYGVEVVFNNEKNRNARINAVMAVTSLRKLIPVIEQTLQIKIDLDLVNNRLIVQ